MGFSTLPFDSWPRGRNPNIPKRKAAASIRFRNIGYHGAESTKHLNQQFQARTIQKRYVALLDGWVDDDQGRISAAIAKGESRFSRVKICAVTGKEAITDYTVLERLENPRRSLVQLTPQTGRTHQLRIHSWAMGHPILGCDLYKNDHSEMMAKRLQLHASDLVFEHPVTGKQFDGQCAADLS